MKKGKRIRNAVYLMAVGALLLCCPLQVSGGKEMSNDMQVAVTMETAQIYREAMETSGIVKTVAFGQQLDAKQICGDWYQVPGGYIRKNAGVLYDKSKKHIALTFDDGPSETNTETVLDALEEYNARATFMVIGQNVNSSTGELLKREQELGCEIANHSYSHANFKKITPKNAEDELKKTDEIVEEYTGEKPTLIRTPYGLCSKNVLCCLDRPNIFWSVDTEDWKYKDSDRLIRYVAENASDGGIVLMHDIHKTTARAVESILEELTEQGYEMVTVTELSAIKGVNLKAGKTYSSFEDESEA